MKRIKYFSLAEFINSATAKRLSIDNTPTFEIVDNLNRLADYLDGIREKLGKPILVSSGYRCPVLNKAVGKQAVSTNLLKNTAKVFQIRFGFTFQFAPVTVNPVTK